MTRTSLCQTTHALHSVSADATRDQLALLPAGLPDREAMHQLFDALRHQSNEAGAALRITRQLVLERLLSLDCDQAASLQGVTSVMTDLAEFALDQACTHALQSLDEVHGAPLTAQGRRASLWVVGMGKFGARELNVSSDIDLIYVYDQDGETSGSSPEGAEGFPTMSTSPRPCGKFSA